MKKQQGISFIEIIVVVAVIAILGSIAAPGMNTWSCQKSVKNDLETVINMLEVQRQNAIYGTSSFGVSILQTTPVITFNQYSAEWCGAPLSNNTSITLDKLKLIGPSDEFCFEPDGSAKSNVNGYGWYLQAACGNKNIDYRIRLFQATGFILAEQKNQSTSQWDEI